MSAKFLAIFRALLCLLVFANLASSAPLNCSNLNADQCKAEFRKIFDKGTKDLHLTYSKNLLEKYVSTFNTILNGLPANDKHQEPVKAKIAELATKITTFDQAEENVQDTVALMVSSEEKFEPDFRGIDFDSTSKKRYKRLKKTQSKTLTDFNNQELEKIYDGVMNLWFQLYAGLRDSDLKAYNNFEEVNDAFKGLQTAQPSWKSMLYWGAVEKSAEFLKLEYYQKLLDEIHEQS